MSDLTASFSRKHKFIYLAPQRTGSRSVNPVLQKYCDMEVRMHGIKISPTTIPHFWNLEGKFEDYDILTTCRNPYLRAVSLYKWRGFYKFPVLEISKYTRSVTEFLGDMLPRVKYLIRLERLPEDLKKVPGIPADAVLPQFDELNNPHQTNGIHWKEFYKSQETADVIYERYKDDFVNFGYEKMFVDSGQGGI